MYDELIVFSDAQGWICTCGRSGETITGASAHRAADMHANEHAWTGGPDLCWHVDIRNLIVQQENAARSATT